jgi:hypothetical protein
VRYALPLFRDGFDDGTLVDDADVAQGSL